jgi:hypothetical protein
VCPFLQFFSLSSALGQPIYISWLSLWFLPFIRFCKQLFIGD